METLGKRIMQNRKRLGLTQDQLAEKLGITAQAVSKWENDLSCPDISMLSQLAEIFGITTDQLLGRTEQIVHEGEVVEKDNKCHWDVTYNGGQKNALGFSVFVLSVGLLYLLANLLHRDIGFWRITWTSALLVLGSFSISSKFSFFSLGCILVGGYSLLSRIFAIHLNLGSGVVVSLIILLFGLSLLMDALKLKKKPSFNVTYTDADGLKHQGKKVNNYQTMDDSFKFDASFGENRQMVNLPTLRRGEISTNFGEFTVSLAGVSRLAPDATLKADCSFGELEILVPARFEVRPESSTTFASFEVQGQPDASPEGLLTLDASVSFGHIKVCYI